MKKNYFRIGGNALSVIFSMICATPMLAQVGKTVQGTVTEHQLPLSGAMITEKGTDNHTFSDSQGNYQLTLTTDQAILIIETPNLSIREEEVKNRTLIPIECAEDTIGLNEVVLNAGYYAVKDKERTGAIARITAKEIENQPVNNVLDALQGRVAGLEITPTTGVAGGGYTIRLRGQNSIAAGNEPLFIIDGVPFDMNSMSYVGVSGQVLPLANVSPLNSLDPNMIESIEILKDADATAIYGSRGANGVILITTKKGKNGKTSFQFESQTTITEITKKAELLSTDSYLKLRKDAFSYDRTSTYPSTAFDVNGQWKQDKYTDWQQVFIGNKGINHTMNGTISGGNENTSFMLSTALVRESSVFYGNFNYNRFSNHFNLNHNSNDKRFAINLAVGYSTDQNKLPTSDLTKKALSLSPNAPDLYNEDGTYNWENSTWANPVAALNSYYKSKANQFNSSLNIKYKLFPFLEFLTSAGYNKNDLLDKQFNPNTTRNPSNGSTSEVSNQIRNTSIRESWIIEPQLNASFNFDKHQFNSSIGLTFNTQDYETISLAASGFLSNDLIDNITAANSIVYLNNNAGQYNYQAVYGRLNYNYDRKYFINITGRRDGSSRFSPENRFANFGAIGAAWIFTEEDFLKGNKLLSFGKIRGSYGVTGNDQIGDYQYLDNYTITKEGNALVYLQPSRLYNPNFGWEKNNKLNIGLELGFLKNKIQLNVDYYDNRSDNQLIGYTLPATTGFTAIQSNLNAVVQNKGIELGLQVKPIDTPILKWMSAFNLTIPSNKLLKYDELASSNYANQFVIGQSLSIRKLYHLTGINPTTGLFEFEDFNKDQKITAIEDKKVIVDTNPQYYGNLVNSFTWNNLNFDFNFQFTKKKGYHLQQMFTMPGTMSNQLAETFNYWNNSANPLYQIPSNGSNSAAYTAYQNYLTSDAIIVDRSFIRLKTLAIQYNLPKKLVDQFNLQLYVQGQNLFTISKYKVADPEHNQNFLPPLRRYTIGMKLNF